MVGNLYLATTFVHVKAAEDIPNGVQALYVNLEDVLRPLLVKNVASNGHVVNMHLPT